MQLKTFLKTVFFFQQMGTKTTNIKSQFTKDTMIGKQNILKIYIRILVKLLRTKRLPDALHAVYDFETGHREDGFLKIEINPQDMF